MKIFSRKKIYFSYPSKPLFFYIKLGFNWVFISWTCFPDVYSEENVIKPSLRRGKTHELSFVDETPSTDVKKKKKEKKEG